MNKPMTYDTRATAAILPVGFLRGKNLSTNFGYSIEVSSDALKKILKNEEIREALRQHPLGDAIFALAEDRKEAHRPLTFKAKLGSPSCNA